MGSGCKELASLIQGNHFKCNYIWTPVDNCGHCEPVISLYSLRSYNQPYPPVNPAAEIHWIFLVAKTKIPCERVLSMSLLYLLYLYKRLRPWLQRNSVPPPQSCSGFLFSFVDICIRKVTSGWWQKNRGRIREILNLPITHLIADKEEY